MGKLAPALSRFTWRSHIPQGPATQETGAYNAAHHVGTSGWTDLDLSVLDGQVQRRVALVVLRAHVVVDAAELLLR